MRTILSTALLALTLTGCTEVQERYAAIIEPEQRPEFTIQTDAEGETREEACAYALQPAQLLADLYGLRIYNHEYGGIQLDLEDECDCFPPLISVMRHSCTTHLAVRE